MTEHEGRMTEKDLPGTAENPVCDFCLATDPKYDYDCERFMTAALGLPETDDEIIEYVPPWAACEPCSQLIEAKDKDGLIARICGPQAPRQLIAMMTLLINNFWRRRIGERKAFGG